MQGFGPCDGSSNLPGAIMEKIAIALGGNALIKARQLGRHSEQLQNVRKTCRLIAGLARRGYLPVITHGNGPQVGNLQIQMAEARGKVPEMPLDVDGAMTQGQIGYMLQQSLKNLLPGREVATVVTQVVVDAGDSAFRNPTKPIGPSYSKQQAKKFAKKFRMVLDAGRGYRRVVPSPKPKRVVELGAIKKLIAGGALVIACGGGGIPVIKTRTGYRGVEAVIDKDRATRLLANSLGIKTMVILTDVEFVLLNYGKNNQARLHKVKAGELRRYLREGHFAEGSMRPKIEASLNFLSRGGRKVIITSLDKLIAGIDGKTGTVITK